MDSIGVMKLTLFILILLFVAISLCCVYQRYTDNFETIHSELDGRKYHVRSNHTDEDKKATANYLATISKKVDKLVEYMYDNQLPDKTISKRLKKRWKNCSLKETAHHENSAAYTVNKGDELRLCVKSDNKFEDVNTSMFVILHELAHIMSVTYGHNEEFRKNFSYIVHLASSLGVYKPQNFGEKPVAYCGSVVTINSTPCQGNTCDYTTVPTDPAYHPGV